MPGRLYCPSLTALVLAGALSAAGCDGFASAQQADTIEAYEAYLEAHPDGSRRLEATTRLEVLYRDRARDLSTRQAYDEALARFPEGHLRDELRAEREKVAFAWARAEATAEAWQTFLKEHPRAAKFRMLEAKEAAEAAAYAANLTVSAVRVDNINLAEDPEGPLNGKALRADVSHVGDRTITTLVFVAEFLGSDGHVIGRKKWPLVAPRFPVPMEAKWLEPMAPGTTRLWEYTTGDIPDGWSGEVRLVPAKIRFADKT